MRILSRGKAAVPVLAALSIAVVLAAVSIGLRVPGRGRLSPFASPGGIDYSAVPPGGFAPLDPRLVSQILGPGPSLPDGLAATSPGGLPSSPILPPSSPRNVAQHPFSNDSFERAYPIGSIPFTADTNATSASRQPGEPSDCAAIGGTAWYRFDAPEEVGLLANTFGSGRPTSIGVYQGEQLDDLTPVACAGLEPRGKAVVTFPAEKGERYYFQIAAPVGGRLVFTLELQGITTLASTLPNGEPADGDSIAAAISHDGRYVLFSSGAASYHQGPSLCPPISAIFPCAEYRLYLKDRRSHRITSFDERPLGPSMISARFPVLHTHPGALSDDGRFAGFYSSVADYAEGDTNQHVDVFVWDNTSGAVTLVSAAPSGRPGDDGSGGPFLSSDGRYAAFSSQATDLVSGDTNGVADVFVRDMLRGRTVRVSVPDPSVPGSRANGGQASAPPEGTVRPADYGSLAISISRDGRYVLFISPADNLVPGDTNGAKDVFLRDLLLGRTRRVNVPDPSVPAHQQNGGQANGPTLFPLNVGMQLISEDGRFVVFSSEADNLVPDDTNGREDVFVRDVVAGRTVRVSVAWNGKQADSGAELQLPPVWAMTWRVMFAAFGIVLTSSQYSMTPDGRYVVFSSDATNLVPGDTNGTTDIFLRDLVAGTTTLISVSTSGEQADSYSAAPNISGDGRFVTFNSLASNLVEGAVDESGPVHAQIYVRELPGSSEPSGWY